MKEYDHATKPDAARPAVRPRLRYPIIKTGSTAIDAAIAGDATHDPPEIGQLVQRAHDDAVACAPPSDTRSFAAGRPASSMALTLDREGHGPTLHVATVHRIVDVRKKSRTILVWHELGTFGRN